MSGSDYLSAESAARRGRAAKSTYSTLVDLLIERFAHQPDDLAYVFRHYSPNIPESEATHRVTYAVLIKQAAAVAAELQQRGLHQEPVVLLFDSGLEFIRAYLGCLLAGAIGVPVRPSLTPVGQRQALTVCADSRARLVLTTNGLARALELALAGVPALRETAVLSCEQIDPRLADQWREPEVDAESLALLQYSSGSTGVPKGVMVSHANLLANEAVIKRAFAHDESTCVVGWLPMFHDMGLIGNVLQPLYVGRPSVLMSPLAFVQKPLRWLQLISEWRATTSGGPNFAYELCVRRVSEEEKKTLDLSSWTLAFSGAEPVDAGTLRRFADAFSSTGFQRRALYPCYGLAESTLFVTGVERGAGHSELLVSRSQLGANRAVPSGQSRKDTVELVGCGMPRLDQTVRIVDPDTLTLCADGEVGEIWLAGASTALGYWGKPQLSEETFRARTVPTDGVEYLRTGDLGFKHGGALYVSGRLRDLIIVRGQNHYPQDIEATAAGAHMAFRGGTGVAFSVMAEGEESVVLVQEVKRKTLDVLRDDDALKTVRSVIARAHGLQLHELVLVEPRAIPKTSSGKVRRQLCKSLYQNGDLRRVQARSMGEGRC